jgi:hypothetical protein
MAQLHSLFQKSSGSSLQLREMHPPEKDWIPACMAAGMTQITESTRWQECGQSDQSPIFCINFEERKADLSSHLYAD